MSIKKSLLALTTGVALALGATGCSLSQSSYSPLENEVYKYCNSFSRKIPKGFVNKGECYHDSSLTIEDCESGFGSDEGKGRLVSRSKESDEEFSSLLVAAYIDSKEFIDSDEFPFDPNHLKNNIIFTRVNVGYEQLIKKAEKEELTEEEKEYLQEVRENVPYNRLFVLAKGNKCVAYMEKDHIWRVYKDVSVREFENIFDADESMPPGAEPAEASKVKRYIKLAERIEQTYFKE